MTTATKTEATVKVGEAREANVFAKGVLVHIDVRIPGMYSRLPEEHLNGIPEEKRKLIRATFDKLDDKSLIEAMNSLRGRMKSYLNSICIPFPVYGLSFVLKADIQDCHDRLTSLEQQIAECFEDFLSAYPALEAQFAQDHPDLYDPAKYPTAAYLQSHFRAKHSFRQFTVPDQEMSMLSPEIYKQEVQKFRDEMQEVRDMTLDVCKTEMLKKIDSLKKQCIDDTINTSTVNAVNDFLEKFDRLYSDFIDDNKVKEMIADVKEYMSGTEADYLRADESFRKLVGDKMGKVSESLQAIPDKKAKRRIEL